MNIRAELYRQGVGGAAASPSRLVAITTEHSASSDGLPVVIDSGSAYGPADLPPQHEIYLRGDHERQGEIARAGFRVVGTDGKALPRPQGSWRRSSRQATEQMACYVSPGEAVATRQAAAREALSVSSWLRQLVRRAVGD